jgi:hypothetical protein
MPLTDDQLAFLRDNRAAAMITIGADGLPKAVRVGIALVDGLLWSSGVTDRVRTGRLRRDPRCTLYVHEAAHRFLTLETTVTLLEGDDGPVQSLRLFRHMQGRPEGPVVWYGEELDEDAFLRRMAEEGRMIYQFQVQRAYGLLAGR